MIPLFTGGYFSLFIGVFAVANSPGTRGRSEDDGLGLGALLLNDRKRCWQNSWDSSLSRKVCMKTLKPSKSISWGAGGTDDSQHFAFVRFGRKIRTQDLRNICSLFLSLLPRGVLWWCVFGWKHNLNLIESFFFFFPLPPQHGRIQANKKLQVGSWFEWMASFAIWLIKSASQERSHLEPLDVSGESRC